MFRECFRTPLGFVIIEAGQNAVTRIWFSDVPREKIPGGIVRRARTELEEYFSGRRQKFSLPLEPCGTVFQEKVWQELLFIPYGRCVSYGDIARRIGKPGAARAVGQAVGKNPLAVVVPCHRVIGENGNLTGFTGGLYRKKALLKLEQENAGIWSARQMES